MRHTSVCSLFSTAVAPVPSGCSRNHTLALRLLTPPVPQSQQEYARGLLRKFDGDMNESREIATIKLEDAIRGYEVSDHLESTPEVPTKTGLSVVGTSSISVPEGKRYVIRHDRGGVEYCVRLAIWKSQWTSDAHRALLFPLADLFPPLVVGITRRRRITG